MKSLLISAIVFTTLYTPAHSKQAFHSKEDAEEYTQSVEKFAQESKEETSNPEITPEEYGQMVDEDREATEAEEAIAGDPEEVAIYKIKCLNGKTGDWDNDSGSIDMDYIEQRIMDQASDGVECNYDTEYQ